jgi:hypothetical protein
MSPVSLEFFVPITTGSTYNGTHKLVERDNSLSGTLLAAFAQLGGSVVLFSARIAAEGRLGHEHRDPTHLLDLWQ